MDAVYLKSQGLKHKEISLLCRISKDSLTQYLKMYRDGGIDGLKKWDYKGKENELVEHEDTLKEYFRNHPPRSIAEARAAIEEITGITRSPTQVGVFLKRIGMKVRKVGFVPGKATDPDHQEKQEKFLNEELKPRLEEAKRGERTLFFVDAAHFVHGAFLGFVWCFCRLFIPSPSGRKRFNVLGALNAVTREVLKITNDRYINSESVCQLLLKIADTVGHGYITLVLDNARYQKCKLVKDYAEILGIENCSFSPRTHLT